MAADKCTVLMDGVVHTSQDFVAILAKDTGDASIFYNTDAMTLGMSVKMVAKAFVECINQCTPQERNDIEEILGEAFVTERLMKDGQD